MRTDGIICVNANCLYHDDSMSFSCGRGEEEPNLCWWAWELDKKEARREKGVVPDMSVKEAIKYLQKRISDYMSLPYWEHFSSADERAIRIVLDELKALRECKRETREETTVSDYKRADVMDLINTIESDGLDYALTEYDDWDEFNGTELGTLIDIYRNASASLKQGLSMICEKLELPTPEV